MGRRSALALAFVWGCSGAQAPERVPVHLEPILVARAPARPAPLETHVGPTRVVPGQVLELRLPPGCYSVRERWDEPELPPEATDDSDTDFGILTPGRLRFARVTDADGASLDLNECLSRAVDARVEVDDEPFATGELTVRRIPPPPVPEGTAEELAQPIRDASVIGALDGLIHRSTHVVLVSPRSRRIPIVLPRGCWAIRIVRGDSVFFTAHGSDRELVRGGSFHALDSCVDSTTTAHLDARRIVEPYVYGPSAVLVFERAADEWSRPLLSQALANRIDGCDACEGRRHFLVNDGEGCGYRCHNVEWHGEPAPCVVDVSTARRVARADDCAEIQALVEGEAPSERPASP